MHMMVDYNDSGRIISVRYGTAYANKESSEGVLCFNSSISPGEVSKRYWVCEGTLQPKTALDALPSAVVTEQLIILSGIPLDSKLTVSGSTASGVPVCDVAYAQGEEVVMHVEPGRYNILVDAPGKFGVSIPVEVKSER